MRRKDTDSAIRMPGSDDGLVRGLLQRIDALLDQVAVLTARIAELEARLDKPAKTPDNSSLPPSSSQKADRPAPARKPRKGHPGAARTLCPDPDHVRDVRPERCPGCGANADTAAAQTLAQAYDHIDLPPIRPVTTRINLWRTSCSCCGTAATAVPPQDMPAGSPFGPGIAALIVYLHTCHFVSYARLAGLLQDVFGLTISQGAIANILRRAAKPAAAASERIAAAVRAGPVVHCDETSARVMGKTHWQWVFGSARAVWHTIAGSRGKATATDFLAGARPEVWVSDRLPAQGGHAAQHQYCLAHLIRDAQYAIDSGDAVFAPAFKALLKDACAVGRRREGLADTTLAAHRRRIAAGLDAVFALEPASRDGTRLKMTMAANRDKLFVFLRRRDVPATNNASERALRPSVIFRKVTNGFRSAWGAEVYAAICSVIATAALDGKSALAALRLCLDGPHPAQAR